MKAFNQNLTADTHMQIDNKENYGSDCNMSIASASTEDATPFKYEGVKLDYRYAKLQRPFDDNFEVREFMLPFDLTEIDKQE